MTLQLAIFGKGGQLHQLMKVSEVQKAINDDAIFFAINERTGSAHHTSPTVPLKRNGGGAARSQEIVAESLQKGGKRKRGQAPKVDPTTPGAKKPTSSYLFFTKDNRHFVKGMKFQEGNKKLAGMWNKLSEAEKQPYIKLAKEDQERYLKEKAEIEGTSPVVKKSRRKPAVKVVVDDDVVQEVEQGEEVEVEEEKPIPKKPIRKQSAVKTPAPIKKATPVAPKKKKKEESEDEASSNDDDDDSDEGSDDDDDDSDESGSDDSDDDDSDDSDDDDESGDGSDDNDDNSDDE
jgi:hypothetical protein